MMKMASSLNAMIADAVKAAIKALAGALGRGPTARTGWVRITPPETALRRSRAYWGTRPGYGNGRSGRPRGGC